MINGSLDLRECVRVRGLCALVLSLPRFFSLAVLSDVRSICFARLEISNFHAWLTGTFRSTILDFRPIWASARRLILLP